MSGKTKGLAGLALLALLSIPATVRGQAAAAAFQPVVGQIPDGAMLSVTPVVSADRRYVRMTLAPIFNTFSGFDTIGVPLAVGGGFGFGGFMGGNPPGSSGFMPGTPGGFSGSAEFGGGGPGGVGRMGGAGRGNIRGGGANGGAAGMTTGNLGFGYGMPGFGYGYGNTVGNNFGYANGPVYGPGIGYGLPISGANTGYGSPDNGMMMAGNGGAMNSATFQQGNTGNGLAPLAKTVKKQTTKKKRK
jgi:hypothetical protein